MNESSEWLKSKTKVILIEKEIDRSKKTYGGIESDSVEKFLGIENVEEKWTMENILYVEHLKKCNYKKQQLRK